MIEHKDGCPSGDFGPCDCNVSLAQDAAARPEAEYVKAMCKELRNPGAAFSSNGKAADLIETLYLASLGSLTPAALEGPKPDWERLAWDWQQRAFRAERALTRTGWTYTEGAEEWKPPIGPSALPLLERISELQYEAGQYQSLYKHAIAQVEGMTTSLTEARSALVAFKDAVLVSGKLNGREYVGLGIQVNAAIDDSARALSHPSTVGEPK